VTREVFTLADQAMIYLLGVLVASSRLSRVPSLVAAMASIAALNFFFVPPHFTFAVANVRYVVTFLVMLLVAIVVSRRTVRMREDADAAREGERRAASLFAMSRDYAAAETEASVAEVAVRNVRSLLSRDAVVLTRLAHD